MKAAAMNLMGSKNDKVHAAFNFLIADQVDDQVMVDRLPRSAVAEPGEPAVPRPAGS
jgi:hypothetical protein